MRITDIVEKLGLKVIAGEKGMTNEITGGYTSDLLSDVMGNAKSGEIWITMQSHKNVIAVASLKELSAILIVNNNATEKDMTDQANGEGIPVLQTSEGAFEISAKIYNLINK